MITNKTIARTYYEIDHKGNSYHVNFYLRVLSRYDHDFDVDNPAPAKMGTQLTCFRTAVTAEDDFFKRITKSDLTPQIQEADGRRDTNSSSLRAMAQAFAMNSGDAQKQSAGQTVLDLMKHYQLSNEDNYENQGSKTLQFCQAIDGNPQYTQAIAAIGATPFYTALKQANEDCRRLIDQRNVERAGAPQQKMVDLRKVTDAEYRDLIWITNAYAAVDADPDRFAWLINTLNEDINYYEKTIFAGGKDDEEAPDEKPDGGGDDGGDTPEPTPEPEPTPVTPE